MNDKKVSWEKECAHWVDVRIVSNPKPCEVAPAGKALYYYWFSFPLSRPTLSLRWIRYFYKAVRAWQKTGDGTQVKLAPASLRVLCSVRDKGRLSYYKRELEEVILPRTNQRYRQYLKRMAARERWWKQQRREGRKQIQKILADL